jgi:hypothetical protein
VGIEEFLGLSDSRTGLLAEARDRWAGWSGQWAALGEVSDGLEGVRSWLRAHGPDDRDRVLVALARLGSAAGPDDAAAAAVLAWVLLPGAYNVRSVVMRQARSMDPHRPGLDRVVDQAIASQLWIEARTVRCATGERVAATVLMNTRYRAAATIREGLALDPDAKKAGVSLEVADPVDLSAHPDTTSERRTGDALWDVLEWAYSESIITREDGALLLALAQAATLADTGVVRRPQSGLLGTRATEMTAQQLGIGASTVRRRAARTLDALRVSARPGAQKTRPAVSSRGR